MNHHISMFCTKIPCLIATACLLLGPLLVSAQSQELHRVETSKTSLESLLKQKISMPARMSTMSKAKVTEVVTQIGKGNLQVAYSKWTDVVKSLPQSSMETDIGLLMMWVVRESYKQSSEDLRFYQERVKYFNEVKKQLREMLTEAYDVMSNFGNDQNKVGIDTFDGNIPKFVSGKYPKLGFTLTMMNKEEVDTYIEFLEQTLVTVGDDAQLANIDLQNNLQRLTQTTVMLSSISKNLHDTAMAIIRNLR